MQGTASTAVSVPKVFWMLLGLAGVSVAMTVLFLGMRAVMGVGGFCAEGGPFQIAVHCPENVAVLIPVSIFVGLAGTALYLINRTNVQ